MKFGVMIIVDFEFLQNSPALTSFFWGGLGDRISSIVRQSLIKANLVIRKCRDSGSKLGIYLSSAHPVMDSRLEAWK